MPTAAERFRAWRKQMGLSLRQVRDAVNEHLPRNRQIYHSLVAKYEKDLTPTVWFLDALKKAYPYDGDVLDIAFGREELPEPVPPEEPPWYWGLESLFDPLGPGAHEILMQFYAALGAYEEFREDVDKHFPGYPTEEGSPLARLERTIFDMAFRPFQEESVFVSLDDLTQVEAGTYMLNLLAALRPLIKPLRDDPRRAKPWWAGLEEDGEMEGSVP